MVGELGAGNTAQNAAELLLSAKPEVACRPAAKQQSFDCRSITAETPCCASHSKLCKEKERETNATLFRDKKHSNETEELYAQTEGEEQLTLLEELSTHVPELHGQHACMHCAHLQADDACTKRSIYAANTFF
jgi:hypothetical protein